MIKYGKNVVKTYKFYWGQKVKWKLSWPTEGVKERNALKMVKGKRGVVGEAQK